MFKVHDTATAKQPRRPARPQSSQVEVRKVHDALMEYARSLCVDETRAFRVQSDGSVLIVNR